MPAVLVTRNCVETKVFKVLSAVGKVLSAVGKVLSAVGKRSRLGPIVLSLLYPGKISPTWPGRGLDLFMF